MWPLLRGDETALRITMTVRERMRENNVYLHSLPTGAWEGAQEEA